VYDIALTNEEIEKITKVDLSRFSKGYAVTRDYFVINCNLGLRYSDWNKITKQNIVTIGSQNYIGVTMQKTNRRVTIPINNQVKTILEKYDGQLPKVAANQTCNRYLKEIAKQAGLTDEVSKPISKAGQLKNITLIKYEMVGTHTARRSFATNAYLRGMDTMLIRNITGHQDERELLKYIKINSLQQSLMAAKHSFFQ
jgi:integrase